MYCFIDPFSTFFLINSSFHGTWGNLAVIIVAYTGLARSPWCFTLVAGVGAVARGRSIAVHCGTGCLLPETWWGQTCTTSTMAISIATITTKKKNSSSKTNNRQQQQRRINNSNMVNFVLRRLLSSLFFLCCLISCKVWDLDSSVLKRFHEFH